MEAFPQPQQQGHSAQHTVHLREEVQAAGAARPQVDAGQVRYRAGEAGQHPHGVGSLDCHGIGTRWSHGARISAQGEAGHHRRVAHRARQDGVVLGEVPPRGLAQARERLGGLP